MLNKPKDLKAPKGKFRVVCVDTFDGTDWIGGDYKTKTEALAAAQAKGGDMLMVHVYDYQGHHIGEAGRF